MDTFPQALQSRVSQQRRIESRPRAQAGTEVEFEAEVASVSDRIHELRARGLTPKQIREELPGVSPWAVNCAINRDASVQAAHPGLRARARDADRDRARALRLEGNVQADPGGAGRVVLDAFHVAAGSSPSTTGPGCSCRAHAPDSQCSPGGATRRTEGSRVRRGRRNHGPGVDAPRRRALLSRGREGQASFASRIYPIHQ